MKKPAPLPFKLAVGVKMTVQAPLTQLPDPLPGYEHVDVEVPADQAAIPVWTVATAPSATVTAAGPAAPTPATTVARAPAPAAEPAPP